MSLLIYEDLLCGRNSSVDESVILSQLEELAGKLGIRIRYEVMKKEDLFNTGGLCRLKGEYILIVNSSAGIKEKIQTFASAVKHFDLDQVYMPPALREYLEMFSVSNVEGES